MIRKYLFPILLIICLFGGCKKDVTDCEFTVQTLVKESAKAQPEIFKDVQGYLFEADTSEYYIDSYNSLREGKAKNIKTGNYKECSFISDFDQTTQLLLFPNLKEGRYIVAVCDTISQIYSYKGQLIVGGGLKSIFVKATFLPYNFINNPDTVFLENKWVQKKNVIE